MVIQFIAAAATVASVGMQIFGASEQKKAQKEQARIAGLQAQLAKQQIGIQEQQLDVSQRVYGEQYQSALKTSALEKQAEDVRFQAMQADAGRRQLENVRMYQRARSLGLTTATSQGAQFGTGLVGAYGQASGQSAWNVGSITQQLGYGTSLFNINREATLNKEAIAATLYQAQQEQFALTRQGFSLAKQGADLNSQMVAAGGKASEAAGIASIGSAIGGSIPALGRIGGNIFGGGGSEGGSSNAFFPSDAFMNNSWGW